MKRRISKIAAGACAASLAFSMAGCAGMAESSTSASSASSESSLSSQATNSDSSLSFEPEDNFSEPLYGPPPEDVSSDAASPEEFDAESNENALLYGPPDLISDTVADRVEAPDDASATESTAEDSDK